MVERSPDGGLRPADIEQLRIAVVRLERKLRRHSGTELTPSQSAVLFTLHRAGPMRPRELAESEQISRPTATGLITRLEAKGLVQRIAHPDDARSCLLSVTPEGEKLLRQGADRAARHLQEWITQLDGGDAARLRDAVPSLSQLSGPSR